MTGEQTISKGNNWQQIAGVSGNIILQNQSPSNSIYYYIGSSAPSLETGVNLRCLHEHLPNIRASEALYVRAIIGDAKIAWSE